MSKDILSINVNEHTEKKNGLTYLSWAWAWAEVLKIDASADWFAHEYGSEEARVPYMVVNGTAMVKTTVTINSRSRSCMLPVMDHRNKAIPNPDAFAVNTAIMRCMTKAISMHGLGLYIYAGEDLPQVASEEDEARAKRGSELEEYALYMIDAHENGKDMDACALWYDAKNWSADNPTEQEERLYVWGLLKKHSKLRATIKANKPEEVSPPSTT